MKLRNKKTGEIIDVFPHKHSLLTQFNSLAELEREWEDYEEPKYIYWLDNEGNVNHTSNNVDDYMFKKNKEIGNYFETKEEAEKAKEKLKAWKRLRDKGFRFKGYTDDSGDLFSCQVIRCSFDYSGNYTESRKDLDLLFSGGEE